VNDTEGAWRQNRWVRWLGTARVLGGKPGTDAASGRRDTMRLVTFSDGVFAISITLLILEIKPPSDYGHLLHGLAALWPSYIAYALTSCSSDKCGSTTTSCSITFVRPTESYFS
jgi:hypothetical protein